MSGYCFNLVYSVHQAFYYFIQQQKICYGKEQKERF